MANSTRIQYNAAALGGKHLAAAILAIKTAQDELAFCKMLADSVSGGGTTPANLEGHQDWNAATGSGQTLYDQIVSLKAAVANVTAAQIGNLYPSV